MAQFRLYDYIDIGTKGYHTATSWRVTKDRAGKQIIDESIADTVNLVHWISPLPDGNGGAYADLNHIYLWVRVHILNDVSPWAYCDVANQNNQMFTITKNGKFVRKVNSLTAGIN